MPSVRPRLDLLHRAPVLAVAPAMDVPLGVLRPAALEVGRFRTSRHSRRERGVAASRSGARPVRRRVGARRAAAIELAHRRRASVWSKRPRAPPPPTGLENEIRGGAVVLVLVRARPAPARAARADRAPAPSPSRSARSIDASSSRARMAPKHGGGSGIASRLSADARDAAGESERAATSESISDRTRARQQVLDRGERAMAFDREIAPRQCRAPREPAHDVGIQASGGEQRRLYGERLELVARAEVGRRRRPRFRPSRPALRASPGATCRARPEIAEASRPNRSRGVARVLVTG